jgi:hypothetical protein
MIGFSSSWFAEEGAAADEGFMTFLEGAGLPF